MQYEGTFYGYARVSTERQDVTSQVNQLEAAGCTTIFREKLTGTHAERPQLKKLMAVLVPGDVVITPAVDRLSRDTTEPAICSAPEPGCGHWRSRCWTRPATLPNWCLPCWGSPQSWSAAAFWSASHEAAT